MASEKQQRLAEPAAWETDEPLGYALAADSSWDAPPATPSPMRQFPSGATRNVDDDKLNYTGFLSARVLRGFATYMHSHRLQADGQLRDAGNWKRGIPIDAYMESMHRHFHEVWETWETAQASALAPAGEQAQLENLYALLFNVQGMAHELLKLQGVK